MGSASLFSSHLGEMSSRTERLPNYCYYIFFIVGNFIYRFLVLLEGGENPVCIFLRADVDHLSVEICRVVFLFERKRRLDLIFPRCFFLFIVITGDGKNGAIGLHIFIFIISHYFPNVQIIKACDNFAKVVSIVPLCYTSTEWRGRVISDPQERKKECGFQLEREEKGL